MPPPAAVFVQKTSAFPNIGNPYYSTVLDAVVLEAGSRGYGARFDAVRAAGNKRRKRVLIPSQARRKIAPS